jgi:predicted nucleic acid-binding protein
MKRLILDTNILISALIKDSITRNLIIHSNYELYSINFSNKEILKYKEQILNKTKQSSKELDLIFETLLSKIILLDDKLICIHFDKAKSIMDKIDPDDTPFIAAALAIDGEIWSDENHFQRQKQIKTWTTKELIALL